MADYHVEAHSPAGDIQLAVIKDFVSLEYARTENRVGAATVTLPISYRDLFLLGNDVRVDTRLFFFRTLPGGTPYWDMEAAWFVQDAEEAQGADGKDNIILYAVDANFILNAHIIAYNADTAYTAKTDLAGDLCKAIVRENLGALATDATRDLSAYLTVQADLGDGANVSKAFARRNVLTTCQEVADKSAQAGSYLAFDVVASTVSALEFRTYASYRGTDHRASSGQPLLVGRDFKNLSDFRLRYSHTGEVTYCYSGGMGQGASRALGSGSDAARMSASPFRRIESWREGFNTYDTTTLNDEASAVVRANRPKISVEGTLAQTDGFIYGKHFKFGDYLTISDRGRGFDARLSSLKVKVAGGKETITGKLRGEA